MDRGIGWERAVIGTALADPQAMKEAEDLMPSDFTGCHRNLWTEMKSLHSRNALELRSLVEALRSAGELESMASFETETTGEAYLAELMGYRGDAPHEYANQVLRASTKRQLRQIAALIKADAEDERIPAEEAADNAERRLIGLRRGRNTGNGMRLADIISVFNKRVQGFLDGTLIPAWVPKIEYLREVVQYVDSEDYIIIAARPGEGKSSIMRYEFVHAATAGMPVLVFNLENSEIEYAKFAISMMAGIDSEKLKNPGRLSEEELDLVRTWGEKLSRIPFYVETMGGPSGKEIEQVARHHISKHNIKLIGVDYVQLMRNGSDKKVEDVSESSSILRSMALRYKTPVIANAQMSRAIEGRGPNAEPQLSDLRESGALEQDATGVWFPRALWPEPTPAQLATIPQNVDPETRQLYSTIKALPVRIHVKKNRNGGTGVTKEILWLRGINSFRSIIRRET